MIKIDVAGKDVRVEPGTTIAEILRIADVELKGRIIFLNGIEVDETIRIEDAKTVVLIEPLKLHNITFGIAKKVVVKKSKPKVHHKKKNKIVKFINKHTKKKIRG